MLNAQCSLPRASELIWLCVFHLGNAAKPKQGQHHHQCQICVMDDTSWRILVCHGQRPGCCLESRRGERPPNRPPAHHGSDLVLVHGYGWPTKTSFRVSSHSSNLVMLSGQSTGSDGLSLGSARWKMDEALAVSERLASAHCLPVSNTSSWWAACTCDVLVCAPATILRHRLPWPTSVVWSF